MRGITVFAIMLALSPGAYAASEKKKATPAREPTMAFQVVRSAHPGCEPECPQWISAQGRIVVGSAAKFRKIVREVGDRKLPIFIDSLGGSLIDGLAMGRLIRSKDLPVVVTATTFSPCTPKDTACRKAKTGGELRGLAQPQMSKCVSACVFVLAGGTRRLVGHGAIVAVHQGVKIQRTYLVTNRRADDGSIKTQKTLTWEGKSALDRRTDEDVRRHLDEMGIHYTLMSMIDATPHESIRVLAPWELKETRIATEYINGEQLITNAPAPSWPTRPVFVMPPSPIQSKAPAAGESSPQLACIQAGQCTADGMPKAGMPSSNVMTNPLAPKARR
jgi:hypothetical protein